MREDVTAISSVSQGTNLNEMTFHEIAIKLQQLLKSQQSIDHRSLMHLLQLGFKIADNFEGQARSEILESCNDLDGFLRQSGNSQNPEVTRRLSDLLIKLRQRIEDATINRIILDMSDIATPLKQFSDVVNSGENRRDLVDQRGQNLKTFSTKISKTATVVSYSCARNKQRSDSLQHLSSRVQNLTPQLINAGTIKINYPENKAADENFENLRKQYADGMQTIRDLCDESIDLKTFLKRTEDHIRTSVEACEDGMTHRQPQKVVDNTALAARLSNRLLMTLYKELDNSEDPGLKRQVDSAGEKLKNAITPFVENGRAISSSPNDTSLASTWRASAKRLLDTVAEVMRLFAELNIFGSESEQRHHQGQSFSEPIIPQLPPPIPPPPVFSEAPPRPPLPAEASIVAPPPRPPMPHPHPHADTDDEEGLFSIEPRSNRPIHLAAHGLYQEVKQVR
jgi:vinculin